MFEFPRFRGNLLLELPVTEVVVNEFHRLDGITMFEFPKIRGNRE